MGIHINFESTDSQPYVDPSTSSPFLFFSPGSFPFPRSTPCSFSSSFLPRPRAPSPSARPRARPPSASRALHLLPQSGGRWPADPRRCGAPERGCGGGVVRRLRKPAGRRCGGAGSAAERLPRAGRREAGGAAGPAAGGEAGPAAGGGRRGGAGGRKREARQGRRSPPAPAVGRREAQIQVFFCKNFSTFFF